MKPHFRQTVVYKLTITFFSAMYGSNLLKPSVFFPPTILDTSSYILLKPVASLSVLRCSTLNTTVDAHRTRERKARLPN